MADIQITDLSNGAISLNSDGKYQWTGTGIFDNLIEAVNSNIKVQFDNGHINTTDYATVYLGAIQSVIATSMDYLLREKLIEAQIDDAVAGIALKNAQTSLTAEQESELVLNGTKDRLLKDEQIASEVENQAVKKAQALLIARQKTAYDDNLRVEEAKVRKDVVFGYALGGQTSSGTELVDMYTQINSIDTTTNLPTTVT